MPDGISEQEYQKFKDWYEKTAGWLEGLPPNDAKLKESRPYNLYQRMNIAQLTPETARTFEETFGALPPSATVGPETPASKVQAALKAQEEAEELLPPKPGDVRTTIEEEGGYSVLVQYDRDDNRSILEVIGRTEALPSAPTIWEQPGVTAPTAPSPTGVEAQVYFTREQAQEAAPSGYIPVNDPTQTYDGRVPGGIWTLQKLPGAAPTGQPTGAGAEVTGGQPTGAGGAPVDPYGRTATWNERLGNWDYPPGWGIDPATQQAGYISPYQQQQLDIQNRAYEAQLMAQPRSWLEYASYTGKTPAIQPWMQPLMPQQYSSLGPGQQIPGWTQQGGTQMPQLTRPSAQYLARMGPTAHQQLLGYRQARTGATPEETEFRLWSAAPPGGQHSGLTRTR